MFIYKHDRSNKTLYFTQSLRSWNNRKSQLTLGEYTLLKKYIADYTTKYWNGLLTKPDIRIETLKLYTLHALKEMCVWSRTAPKVITTKIPIADIPKPNNTYLVRDPVTNKSYIVAPFNIRPVIDNPTIFQNTSRLLSRIFNEHLIYGAEALNAYDVAPGTKTQISRYIVNASGLWKACNWWGHPNIEPPQSESINWMYINTISTTHPPVEERKTINRALSTLTQEIIYRIERWYGETILLYDPTLMGNKNEDIQTSLQNSLIYFIPKLKDKEEFKKYVSV